MEKKKTTKRKAKLDKKAPGYYEHVGAIGGQSTKKNMLERDPFYYQRIAILSQQKRRENTAARKALEEAIANARQR